MRDIFKILKFSSHLTPLYAIVAAMTVLVALLNQATPLLTKQVIDSIVANLSGETVELSRIGLLIFLIFVTDVGVTIFSNLGGYWGDIMAVRLKRFMGQRYYEHLLTLPQAYFDNEYTGKIINRLTRSIETISSFVQMFANNFFQFLLSSVLTLVIVAYFSWEVALMLAILYPVFLWLTQRTSAQWQKEQSIINRHTDIASGRFAEVIGQIRAVKSFIQEKLETRLFGRRFSYVERITKRQSRWWHSRDVERRLVLNVIFFAVYSFIIINTFSGRFTLGEMVLLVQYATFIRIPIFSMSFIVDSTQKAIAGSRDFFEVLALKPAIVDEPGSVRLKVTAGKVQFKNVSFAYEGGDPVLKNVSFTIAPDSRMALIGQSGEGKSTVVNLLLRLYEPTRGTILVDGADISRVSQRSLREQIGVVFQDTSLFSGTVRENITYGKPRATSAEIEAAARAAHAHDFIRKLPKGYKTQIGERGVKLSGGQKQRVAIARALLKDPPILILDEATSSLDSKAEAEVQAALDVLMRGRTTLIIAHRLSTIKDVDKIVSLKRGRVAETGTPARLAKTDGIYAELLHLQDPKARDARKLREYEIVD